MAIFWKDITLANQQSAGEGIFYRIICSDKNPPVFKYSTSVNFDNATDLGEFLLTKAHQTIETPFTIGKVKIDSTTSNGQQYANISLTDENYTFYFNGKVNYGALVTCSNGLEVKGSEAKFFEGIRVGQTATLNKVEVTTTIQANQAISTASYCQALYFNATSDKRAKKDIKPFTGNALDIINGLQTYTYTYLDNNEPSYGVMAQDLFNTKINDFSFVSNPTASGKNGDYMGVKESKLVYLALEAIKQLSKENAELRARIETLEQKRPLSK